MRSETFASAGILVTLLACGAQQSPSRPAYCYDENQLRLRYRTCVTTATTREASDDCADVVNATCGFPRVTR